MSTSSNAKMARTKMLLEESGAANFVQRKLTKPTDIFTSFKPLHQGFSTRGLNHLGPQPTSLGDLGWFSGSHKQGLHMVDLL